MGLVSIAMARHGAQGSGARVVRRAGGVPGLSEAREDTDPALAPGLRCARFEAKKPAPVREGTSKDTAPRPAPARDGLVRLWRGSAVPTSAGCRPPGPGPERRIVLVGSPRPRRVSAARVARLVVGRPRLVSRGALRVVDDRGLVASGSGSCGSAAARTLAWSSTRRSRPTEEQAAAPAGHAPLLVPTTLRQ